MSYHSKIRHMPAFISIAACLTHLFGQVGTSI